AASSLQGLAGKYKGNDLDTAMDAATKSGSRERSVAAAKRDDQLMAKLRAMGINDIGSSTPTEYWDKITSELGQTSKEIASLAQKDGLQDYSKGVTTQARQQLAGTAAYGANVNSGAAVKVSIQDGEVEAKTVNETAKSRSMMGDDYNTDDLAKGRALQGMVKDMNSMGAANANLTKEDLKNMKNTGTASMHSEAGRAEAQSDVMKDDPDFYKKSSEYGERSQVSNIKGSMKAYGNDVDAMAKVVEDDSRIKATQQRESVPATLKATGKTGDAAFEKLGEIAEAMSAAKVVSDINTIKGAGGSKSFITASGDVATEKGGMLKAQSEALRGSTGDEGSVIDSKGDLTEDGQKMLNRSASSKVAETLRRSKITDDKKHMASTIADIANSGTSKEDTESIRNQLLKDGIVKSLKIGSDGKVSATGVEMGDFEAVSRALGAAEGNRLTDKMGGLVFGGREFAVKGDSVSSSKNTVNKTEAGYSNNQNTGAPTSDAGAISKEAAEIAQNPTKWLPTLAGKSTDFISNQLQTKFKMDKETADDAAVGISTALAVAGTGAVLEAGQRLKNAVQGNYVVNESFSYDTGKVDKDGKSIMKTINAGEHISTKGMSPELAEAFQENRNKFEVEKGTLGKGFKKINNSAVDLRNSFTGDQPSEESTTKQNNQKDSNAKTNVSKKFHNDSFKNSDTDIISENESDTKKNGSISEQIEKQTKFDRRSGALKNAQTARDNLLSVTSDPDKIAKINADYDLAEKSINEKYGSYGTNQPTVLDADTPKKGFFGRAAETISKVPFVGKAAAGLMLMASAAEANNQFQNGDTSGAVATMLDIADPSSMGVATQFNNSAKILEGRGFGTGATNQTVFDGFMGGVNRTLDAIGLGSPQQQAVMQAQAAGAPAPGWLTASPTANTQAAVMADKDQPTVNTQVANAQPTNAYPNKEQPATSTQSNNVQPEANTQPMANTQAAVMANNTNQPVANTQSMTNTQVAAIQAQIASPQQQATGAPAPGWLTASPMANTQAAVMADNMHSLVGAAQSQKDMAMHQFTSNAVATTQSMAGNDEIGQMKTNLRDNAEATANTLADHLEQLMENQAVKNDQRSKRLDKED
ncbi:MAG: hypothetical protein U9R50_02330, partial [Campylobacterota bacterium]|nr:hypothetical protein [Campylobacterota bacterium]